MRVALVSDIHANLPALEAVLQHAKSQRVDEIWNAGDSVGYSARPNEILALLRENTVVSIAGNYDRKVLQVPRKALKWQKSKHPLKWRSFQWTFHQLTPENRNYLETLPSEIRLRRCHIDILLTHGSPAAIDEPLYPETSAERFSNLSEIARADLVLCGHTHRPLRHLSGSTQFVNPGSLGRPEDGDPRASYALLHFQSSELKVTHFRVNYDCERAALAIENSDLPNVFGQMLRAGRSLEWILRQS